ncbi:Dabb family protein [Gilvimarinus sp. SDUM040013]|uniref:Dabb family protein n=1 Tax=Gilvimarinus gilvus TaxID=3058038 RepID=A0ABU4S232_9GAMM|nr:Dabb family protein [Gilvimarinus sp. SDUM040013]MDO3384959.1 Dabb family protein [Gilvimarinus sp. SDUM040013]MDX6851245.1 Dabb family protein [Gilvimarinus sp. SDUM040013]
MIRHILLIQFKDASDESEIEKIKAMFLAMPGKVTGVIAVEWGENDSPEGMNQGFTHTVMMTFSDEKARQSYLPHPAHEKLKEVFIPLLEDIIVFDYQV